MDAIIELPYIPLPKSGSAFTLRPGVYTPNRTINVRNGPGITHTVIRYAIFNRPIDIAGAMLFYPSLEMWLPLDIGGTAWVAFVRGDTIFGSVKGWYP